MAKRTFCDRCGAQCVNTIIMLHIVTVHHMKDGTYVGEDEHKPIELCLNCADEVKALVPQAFEVRSKEPREEEAMMAAPPVRDHSEYAQDRMPR